MQRDRSILVGALCACASLTALAAWCAVPAARPTGAPHAVHMPSADCIRVAAPASSARVALAPVAAHTGAQVAPLVAPVVAPRAAERLHVPEVAGLLLDTHASDARLDAWYAHATDEDLVRARFRLERLEELASGSPAVFTALVAATVDEGGVARELAYVAGRVARVPLSPAALAEVATRPHDTVVEFAARHAARSPEDLAVDAWRVQRALELAQAEAIERAFACGAFTVVTESTGWG